ncbi:hypothetical protein [Vibrio atlanticus]|uniref:hypothetical protein n=1 Tax=Vibrio atlanticus TaxID=693153 RepID=UPI003D0D1CFE
MGEWLGQTPRENDTRNADKMTESKEPFITKVALFSFHLLETESLAICFRANDLNHYYK